MKKQLKSICIFLIVTISSLILTGCKLVKQIQTSNFTYKVEKIREKFEDEKIDQLIEIKDLIGSPSYEFLLKDSGVVIWLCNYDNKDINEILANEQNTKVLIVYIINNYIKEIEIKDKFDGLYYNKFKETVGLPTFEIIFKDNGLAIWENKKNTEALFIVTKNNKILTYDIDNKYNELTYEKLEIYMGTPPANLTVNGTGSIIWIDGCKNLNEYESLVEAEESVSALVVMMLKNNIASVEFHEKFEEEAK